MESKYKYEVVEKNEEPLLNKIEKSGQKYQFTLLEVKNNILFLRQKIKELQGVWGIAEAKKINIKNTHPHIAKMSLEDLTAAFLYREAVGAANEAQTKLEDYTELLAEDELALKDSLEQTGIVLPESAVNELKPEPVKEANAKK